MALSDYWAYFTQKSADLAQCQKCSKVLKTQGGSTSGLKRHLERQHLGLVKSSTSYPSTSASGSATTSEGATNLKQRKLQFSPQTKYLLDETVPRLAADDGFSINGIVNCSYSRHAMARYNMKLSEHPNGVTDLIIQYHMTLKRELKRTVVPK